VTDERKGPPRHQTSTERDISGIEAKKKRETNPFGTKIPTHPRGTDLALPHEVEDPITGVKEGKDLDEARAERPDPERFLHLEHRLDAADSDRDDLRKQNADLLKQILEMAGTRFAADTRTREANATSKRELIRNIVLAILAAIGTFFVGRSTK
jgi:hypothetical protein